MLDQYLTIEMLHKSWSLFLFQELNYMYLILSSSFNNFSRGIQLNTLYFSCGKDNFNLKGKFKHCLSYAQACV